LTTVPYKPPSEDCRSKSQYNHRPTPCGFSKVHQLESSPSRVADSRVLQVLCWFFACICMAAGALSLVWLPTANSWHCFFLRIVLGIVFWIIAYYLIGLGDQPS
jgi:hypothetical protein